MVILWHCFCGGIFIGDYYYNGNIFGIYMFALLIIDIFIFIKYYYFYRINFIKI